MAVSKNTKIYCVRCWLFSYVAPNSGLCLMNVGRILPHVPVFPASSTAVMGPTYLMFCNTK